MRFVWFLILAMQLDVANGAHAGSRSICDRLLSSSALTSVANEATSQEPKLSASAQAYVNLIQLYLKNSDEEGGQQILNKILKAKKFINPFAGTKSTIDLQLSPAIEKLSAKITASEWSDIKLTIQDLVNKVQTQKEDRSQKEDKTAQVFKPEIIDIAELNSEIRGSAHWQTINDRIYATLMTDDGRLHLFELVNEKLRKKTSIRLAGVSYRAPAWITVGDRTLMSVATDAGLIYLYEFTNGRFLRLDDYNVGGAPGTSPVWQTIGRRTFLVFAVNYGKVTLYELIQNELRNIDEKHLNLDSDVTLHAAFMHSVNGEFFVVFKDLNAKAYCFKLKSSALANCELTENELESLRFKNGDSDKRLLRLETFIGEISLIERQNKKDKKIFSTDVHHQIFSFSDWKMVGDQLSAAITTRDKIFIFGLEGQELVLRASISVNALVAKEPTWLTVGEETYLAAPATGNNTLILIKAFEKLKK